MRLWSPAGQASVGTAVAETHYCSSTASERRKHGPATPMPRPLPRTPHKAWWCQAAPPVVGSPVTCGGGGGGGGGRAEQSREVVWAGSRVEAGVRDRMGGRRG